MAIDQYQRVINYLRVSVTEACNLRCVYCMPEKMTFRPGPALLQDDEIVALIGIFAELGFEKIRFTGGEPTVRSGIVGLVKASAETPGIRRVALTTNGILLGKLAWSLRMAGLSQVNVSLDTLDANRYRQITRWGNLSDVRSGLCAADRVGMRVKLNVVVVRGLNDGADIVELARLTMDHFWQVRFIEMMPFGGLPEFQLSHTVADEEIRGRISAALGPLESTNLGELDGEARMYRLRGSKGSVGFISPVSNPFCAGCNRARLMADGMLRMCLLREREVDLKQAMRSGLGREAIKKLIKDSVYLKPWGHGLADHQFATNRTMSEIGG